MDRQFEWDGAKDQKNISKHGISFAEAVEIFDGPVFTAVDERFEYDETREISMGFLRDMVVLNVAHTDRAGITRIISARRATKKERRLFHAYLKGALG